MNDLTQYLAARPNMLPGDVIVFSGASGVSPLIELATGSCASHIAVVRQGTHVLYEDVNIIEATIEGVRNGVQSNLLAGRLANYDSRGRAWWLPLSPEVRKAMNWFQFYKYIGSTESRIRYDTAGLFHFLARAVPFIGPRTYQAENSAALFCSGFVAELFEQSGILRGINTSKVTPQDLCEAKLYRECVQILGAPGKIARFNTV